MQKAPVWSTKPDAGVMTTSPHTVPLRAVTQRRRRREEAGRRRERDGASETAHAQAGRRGCDGRAGAVTPRLGFRAGRRRRDESPVTDSPQRARERQSLWARQNDRDGACVRVNIHRAARARMR